MKNCQRCALVVVVLIALAGSVLSLDSVRWRARVVYWWSRGELHDVGWNVLWFMLKPGSGFWLRSLVEGRGLSAAVQNPLKNPQDIEAGGNTFPQDHDHGHRGGGPGVLAPGCVQPRLTTAYSDTAPACD